MSEDDPLRALWRETRGDGAGRNAGPSVGELEKRESALARKESTRRWSESVAGGLSIAALGAIAVGLASMPRTRIAAALLVLGELAVIATLWRRATRRRVPPPMAASTSEHIAHYRAELLRERDALRSVERWYLAPTAPGLLYFPIAIADDLGIDGFVMEVVWAISFAVVAMVIVGVQRRAACRLDREIAALGEPPA
jgi:hypothetical protein